MSCSNSVGTDSSKALTASAAAVGDTRGVGGDGGDEDDGDDEEVEDEEEGVEGVDEDGCCSPAVASTRGRRRSRRGRDVGTDVRDGSDAAGRFTPTMNGVTKQSDMVWWRRSSS